MIRQTPARALFGGKILRSGMIAIVAMLAMFAPSALAQTPVSDATPAAGAESAHPADIYAGNCSALGDVAIPLEVALAPMSTSSDVVVSRAVIDVPVDDLLASEHAVAVHASAEAIDTDIACGDVVGDVTENENNGNDLIISLDDVGDSGYSGIVWFGEDGDQTEVVIILVQPTESE